MVRRKPEPIMRNPPEELRPPPPVQRLPSPLEKPEPVLRPSPPRETAWERGLRKAKEVIKTKEGAVWCLSVFH